MGSLVNMQKGSRESMLEDRFYRQRRNVILMSLLVIFLNTTMGKIEKLSILGTELTIRNPNVLPWLLGIILSYYLLRFVQYAHEIEDKGFKYRFLQRTEKYLAKIVLKREFAKKDSRLRSTYPDLNQIRVDRFLMYDKGFRNNIAYASFVGKKGGTVIEDSNLIVSKMEQVCPFFRSAIYITFRTRLATDYILPWVLAIFAFLTFWPGTPRLLMVLPK